MTFKTMYPLSHISTTLLNSFFFSMIEKIAIEVQSPIQFSLFKILIEKRLSLLPAAVNFPKLFFALNY